MPEKKTASARKTTSGGTKKTSARSNSSRQAAARRKKSTHSKKRRGRKGCWWAWPVTILMSAVLMGAGILVWREQLNYREFKLMRETVDENGY